MALWSQPPAKLETLKAPSCSTLKRLTSRGISRLRPRSECGCHSDTCPMNRTCGNWRQRYRLPSFYDETRNHSAVPEQPTAPSFPSSTQPPPPTTNQPLLQHHRVLFARHYNCDEPSARLSEMFWQLNFSDKLLRQTSVFVRSRRVYDCVHDEVFRLTSSFLDNHFPVTLICGTTNKILILVERTLLFFCYPVV